MSDRADRVAEAAGLSRDELVELVVRSRLDDPNTPASMLWGLYEAGTTQTRDDVIAKLAKAGITDGVRGLRLGPFAPDAGANPWPRPGAGAELWWTPQQTWPSVRGLWRMVTSGVTVIVALRLGLALGVYRINGWVEHPSTGRKFALDGVFISADGRLHEVATGADVGAASTDDMVIFNEVTAAPILMPPARQPVVKLSAR